MEEGSQVWTEGYGVNGFKCEEDLDIHMFFSSEAADGWLDVVDGGGLGQDAGRSEGDCWLWTVWIRYQEGFATV